MPPCGPLLGALQTGKSLCHVLHLALLLIKELLKVWIPQESLQIHQISQIPLDKRQFCLKKSCEKHVVRIPFVKQDTSVSHLKKNRTMFQAHRVSAGTIMRDLTEMTSLRAACLAAGSSISRAAAPLASSSSNSCTSDAASVSRSARAARCGHFAGKRMYICHLAVLQVTQLAHVGH